MLPRLRGCLPEPLACAMITFAFCFWSDWWSHAAIGRVCQVGTWSCTHTDESAFAGLALALAGYRPMRFPCAACARQVRKLMDTEINAMAAVASAEHWASEQTETLQKILDEPASDHGVTGLLPSGGMSVAHVVGLVGELSNGYGGPWKKRYAGRLKGGRAGALHTWLYHLGTFARDSIQAFSFHAGRRQCVPAGNSQLRST